MEEETPQLAVADQRIEFAGGHVEQEADEDPDLHGDEAVPGEVGKDHLVDLVEAARAEGDIDDLLQEPHDQHDDGIEDRLVEDRLDQRRTAELVDDADLVDDQHHLADDQRRRTGQHEAAEVEPVIVRQQVGGEDDQVEGDEEVRGGRQQVADDRDPAMIEAPGQRRDGGRAHILPPSTTKFWAVTIRLSSAASHRTMRAMSGG